MHRRSVLGQLQILNQPFNCYPSNRNIKGLLSHNQQYDSITRTPNSLLCIIAMLYFSTTSSSENILLKKVQQNQYLRHSIIHTPPHSNNLLQKIRIKSLLQNLQKCLQEGDYNQILNQHHSVMYILSILVRQNALQYYLNNVNKYQDDSLGNQINILQDYLLQPRNIPLAIIVDSLNLQIILEIGQYTQKYGSNSNKLKIKINCQRNPTFYSFNLKKFIKNNELKNSLIQRLKQNCQGGIYNQRKIGQIGNSQIVYDQIRNSKSNQGRIISCYSKFPQEQFNSPKGKCYHCFKTKFFCTCSNYNSNNINNMNNASIENGTKQLKNVGYQQRGFFKLKISPDGNGDRA